MAKRSLNKVVVLGATSAIAAACAARLAAAGCQLALVGRDRRKLEAVAADLRTRFSVEPLLQCADFNQTDKIPALVDQLVERLPGWDGVLIAHGALPDQELCTRNAEAALAQLQTNFCSQVALLTEITRRPALNGLKVIAVITSVAGDRGRASNYVYGGAKAGLSVFLAGLTHRLRLKRSPTAVLEIKPGFVNTPMTAHIQPKGLLWAQAEAVARGIVKAMMYKQGVVYLPAFWRLIMLVIRYLPRALFHRLRL